MTPGLFLGIILLMFTIFGVPEDTNKSKKVIIESVKGTIDVEYKDKKVILKDGDEIEIKIED